MKLQCCVSNVRDGNGIKRECNTNNGFEKIEGKSMKKYRVPTCHRWESFTWKC